MCVSLFVYRRNSDRRNLIICAAVLGIISGLILVFTTRSASASAFYLFLVLVPSAVILSVLAMVKNISWLRQTASVLVIASSVAAVPSPIGIGLSNSDIAEGKAYCESLSHAIDAWQTNHSGQLPVSVTGLQSTPLPRLVNGDYYWHDTSAYNLIVRDPVLGFDYVWFSYNRIWVNGGNLKGGPASRGLEPGR